MSTVHVSLAAQQTVQVLVSLLHLVCIHNSLVLPVVSMNPCADSRHKPLTRQLVACPHQIHRSPSSRFYMDPARPQLTPFLHPWIPKADSFQRRHSSSRPDPAPPPIPDVIPYRDKILDILSSGAPFDVDGAWDAYQTFHTYYDPGSPGISDAQLLTFANRILTTIQGELDSPTAPSSWSLWSTRIRGLLTDVEHRLDSADSPTHQHWHSLMARDYALAGSFTHAITHARQLVRRPQGLDKFQQQLRIFETYETICLAMNHHLLPVAVLDLLVEEWKLLGHYLLHHYADPNSPSVRYRLRSFRDTVSRIISYIEQPNKVVRGLAGQGTVKRRQLTVEVYIEFLCRAELGEDALGVFREAVLQQLEVSLRLKLFIVKALVESRSYELANHLYLTITAHAKSDKEEQHILSTGLHLYARQGLVQYAEECFSQLHAQGWANTSDIATLLHLHGVRGDAQNAVKIFEEHFPPGSPHRPGIFHFSAVMFAHSRCADYDGMNAWLEKMVQAGITPDKYVYNIILTSLASRGDLVSMKAVLDQMSSAGFPPTRIEYTTLITQLGKMRDPEAADAVYKRAIKEGIIPDRQMMSALMDVHVEAGSWQGVITTFDYMRSTSKGIRLTIEVYNILLKAYVLVGSPFRVVSRLFQRLDEVDVRPDAHTFALLIQSACDAGFMKTATDLLAEMEKLASQWQTGIHMNVYVQTIIMAGYLRLKDKVRAKAVYDDMLLKGIDPTSITYGLIIRAYGNERSEESITVAEDFLSDLMEREERKWDKIHGTRATNLSHVYSPLMNAYAHRQKPEEVERVFQQMLEAGGQPSLGTLTTLLDAYRRTGNIDALKSTWDQILECAKRYVEGGDPLFIDEDPKPDPNRFKNVLCIPLSIYIDALSSSGRHLEIATIWRELQVQGHTFDSHNWNHLTAALIRAGELERAFEVIEKVILPYRRQTYELIKRPESPVSPLISDLPRSAEDENELDRPPSESPLHSGQRRSVKADLIAKKARTWMVDTTTGDFAHSLNLLYQISPAWNIWRPHNLVLTLLSKALERLQGGRLIQPTTGRHSSLMRDESLVDEEQVEKQTAMAGDILGRIYDNYPLAVQAVRDYEFWQRQQKGKPNSSSRSSRSGGARGGKKGKVRGRGGSSSGGKYRRSS